MKNWEKYKLTELCSKIGSGATPRGGNASYKEEGISLIRSQNILDFVFSKNGLAFIDNEQAKALSNVEMEEGDVLINITGDSVARVCQVPSHVLPARVNQHVAILRANQSKLNPKFLKYALLSHQNKGILLSLASTGATRKALTKSMLEEFEIDAPEDIETQSHIASILSSLDDKIELNRRMNQTLEHIAQALFNHYFVDNIDPDNLPEGWKKGKLGEVCNNIRNSISHNQINSDTAYVGLEHLPRKSLALYGSGNSENLGSNKFKFKENNILFGRLRPYFHKVVFAPHEGVCSTDILVIEPKIQEYYSYSLLHFYSAEIIEYSTQFSHGTRMPRVSWDSLSRYDVAIPPITLASQFNKIILPLLEKIKDGIKEIKIMIVLRDTLLPKLMFGEIDVDAKMKEEATENIRTV